MAIAQQHGGSFDQIILCFFEYPVSTEGDQNGHLLQTGISCSLFEELIQHFSTCSFLANPCNITPEEKAADRVGSLDTCHFSPRHGSV